MAAAKPLLTNLTAQLDTPALAALGQDTALLPTADGPQEAWRLLQVRRTLLYERDRLAAFEQPEFASPALPADQTSREQRLAAVLSDCFLQQLHGGTLLPPPALTAASTPADTGLEMDALMAVADLTGRTDEDLQPAVDLLNLQHVAAFFHWRQDAPQPPAPDGVGFADGGPPATSQAVPSPYPGLAPYRAFNGASLRQLARNVLDPDRDPARATAPQVTVQDLYRGLRDAEVDMYVRVAHQPPWLAFRGAVRVDDGTLVAPPDLGAQLRLLLPGDAAFVRSGSATNTAGQLAYRVVSQDVRARLVAVSGKDGLPLDLEGRWVVVQPSSRVATFYYPLLLAPMTRVLQEPGDATAFFGAGPWPVTLAASAACRAPDGGYSVAPAYAWHVYPAAGAAPQPLADAQGVVQGSGAAALQLFRDFFAGAGTYVLFCALTPPASGCDARVTQGSRTRHVRLRLLPPTGAGVPLDEDGYRALVGAGNSEMQAFVRRVVASLQLRIVDEGGLSGFVPYYSGELVPGGQSLQRMVEELRAAAGQPGSWVQA